MTTEVGLGGATQLLLLPMLQLILQDCFIWTLLVVVAFVVVSTYATDLDSVLTTMLALCVTTCVFARRGRLIVFVSCDGDVAMCDDCDDG